MIPASFRRWSVVIAAVVGLALITSTTHAQSAIPADVDPAELEIRLLPLTQEQLGEEANQWMMRLQAAVTEVANARLEDGDVVAATKSRDDVIARYEVVLTALEAKGGDVTTRRQYVDAVSGLALDVTDVGAVSTFVTDWITDPGGGIQFGINIVLFIVIVIAFRIVGGIVGRLVRKALRKFVDSSDYWRKGTVRRRLYSSWR